MAMKKTQVLGTYDGASKVVLCPRPRKIVISRETPIPMKLQTSCDREKAWTAVIKVFSEQLIGWTHDTERVQQQVDPQVDCLNTKSEVQDLTTSFSSRNDVTKMLH